MENEKFLTELGSKIKQKRLEKKMLQSKLASLCNFDTASMSRLESGQTNPTLLTLRKISIALEIPVAEFLMEAKAA